MEALGTRMCVDVCENENLSTRLLVVEPRQLTLLFSFCREVNAFAVKVLGHRIKVRQTTSTWIVRTLYEATS